MNEAIAQVIHILLQENLLKREAFEKSPQFMY